MVIMAMSIALISFVIKTSSVEIFPVFSFKIRAIVGIVPTVAIVSVPGRVVVINIPGVFIFINDGITLILVNRGRGRSIFIVVCGRGLINNRRRGSYIGGSGRNINSCTGDTEADMCVNVNLRITSGSDEAGGYNGGKNE